MEDKCKVSLAFWGRGDIILVMTGRDDEKIHKQRIEIKPAVVSDAEDMLKIHSAAVRKTASPYYTSEIIENWACPLTEEMRQKYVEAIQRKDEISVVARIDGRAVGFGWVVPKEKELRAVYVHPDFGRRGVGKRILETLESMAVERGVDILEGDASLNAERFYVKNGFTVVEKTMHKMRSGHLMPCVKIRKVLKKTA
jgi:putative acetyltransferase